MRTLKTTAVATTLILAAITLAGPASGEVINVDFDGEGREVTYNPPLDGAPYPGAAVTDIWNSFAIADTNGAVGTQTSASLIESDGVTDSGVTVTLDGGYFWQSNPGPLAGDLFADFIYAVMPETVTFSIDNLEPDGLYDLYLYGGSQDNYNHGENGLGGNFTIDGVAKACNYSGQTLPDLVWMEGDQYVLFSGLAADGSGTISGTMDGAGMEYGEGNFNGLTIVRVPEPSTIVLVIIGAVFLFVSRLRRR